MKATKGKIKIYEPLKERGSYICYYKKHSIDVSVTPNIRLWRTQLPKGGNTEMC